MRIFGFTLTGCGEDEPAPVGRGWPVALTLVGALLSAVLCGWP